MVVTWCVVLCVIFIFFKQKTAYERRISEWSSDVCSSDLISKAVTGVALQSTLDGVAEALRGGDSVTKVGFGTFTVSSRPARTGRNPQTGDRKSVVEGKSVSVRVDLGGRRSI